MIIIISLHIVAVLMANAVHMSKLSALYRKWWRLIMTIAIRGAKLKHMLSANNLWIGCHVHLLWQVLSYPKDCLFQSLQSTLNIDTHFFKKSQDLWIVIDTKGFWIETERTFSGSLSISFDKQTNKENVYKEMYFLIVTL